MIFAGKFVGISCRIAQKRFLKSILRIGFSREVHAAGTPNDRAVKLDRLLDIVVMPQIVTPKKDILAIAASTGPATRCTLIVADAVAVGINVSGSIARTSTAAVAITVSATVTRSAIVADAIAIGIDITRTVSGTAVGPIIANAVVVGIDVTGSVAVAATIAITVAGSAIVADTVVVRINVTGTAARTLVVADAVVIDINVTRTSRSLCRRLRTDGSRTLRRSLARQSVGCKCQPGHSHGDGELRRQCSISISCSW